MTKKYNKFTKQDEKDFSVEAFQKKSSEGFPDNTFALDYLKKNNGLDRDQNGHYFFNIQTLLRWKKAMNREKDRPDIELITKIMQGEAPKKKSSKTAAVRKSSKVVAKKSSKTLARKSSKTMARKSSKKMQ